MAWNKGTPWSEERRAKQAEALARPEVRERMRAAQRARVVEPALGHKMPEELKEKLRAINTGRKHTDETRAKMSRFQRGRPCTWGDKISKTLMGHPVSEETIRKARETKSKNPKPPMVFTPEIREKIRQSKLGDKNANWKGGITKDRLGYEFVRTGNYYQATHRLVMEKSIGRKLEPGEIVHHINKNHRDNRPENLALCRDFASHRWCHGQDSTIFLGYAT